jgi:hypothetical protein
MLPKYLKETENHSATVLTAEMKKVLADTTYLASQVIECNEEEEDEEAEEAEEDTIGEVEDGNNDVNTLLMMGLPFHNSFYTHLV